MGFGHGDEFVEDFLANIIKEKFCAIITLQDRKTTNGCPSPCPYIMEE